MPATTAAIPYHRPTRLKSDDGEWRTVGFELEFTGLTLVESARALTAALGGEVTDRTEARQTIAVPELGEFGVELDWDYLKREAEEGENTSYVALLRDAASLVVPVEIVCPPLAITELERLDPLIEALHESGARGTDDSLIAAYGLHINPSLPDLKAATLDHYLKAFAVLQWWLLRAHEVDLSRKLTPYIDLYPNKYLKRVVEAQAPSLDELIANYLRYNPTRNRALDLLPLLAHIDEHRVRQTIDDARIKPRPTFHYRLPNCLVGTQDWSLASAWNLWCVVEELACRPDDLQMLCRDFLEAWRPLLGVDQAHWVDKVDAWLHDAALV